MRQWCLWPIGIALAAHWKSRGHVLFWLAALVLVAVHTALVPLLPWPTWKMAGPEFAPFASLDFFVNFAVIRWVRVATNRHGRPEDHCVDSDLHRLPVIREGERESRINGSLPPPGSAEQRAELG
jgi:hypothetical protein